jgi:hypothetical protein
MDPRVRRLVYDSRNKTELLVIWLARRIKRRPAEPGSGTGTV